MTKKAIRHSRIIWLTDMAKSGKYTWKELKETAIRFGITPPTAKAYLDEVEDRLRKMDLIK